MLRSVMIFFSDCSLLFIISDEWYVHPVPNDTTRRIPCFGGEWLFLHLRFNRVRYLCPILRRVAIWRRPGRPRGSPCLAFPSSHSALSLSNCQPPPLDLIRDRLPADAERLSNHPTSRPADTWAHAFRVPSSTRGCTTWTATAEKLISSSHQSSSSKILSRN